MYDPANYQRKYGTRSEVFDLQTAYSTRGGLTKDDLVLSRTGKIVSKKKQESARRAYKEFGFAKRVAKEEKKEEVKEEVKEVKKKRRRRKKKIPENE